MRLTNRTPMRCALLLTLTCGLATGALAEQTAAPEPFKRNTLELRGNIGGIDSGTGETFGDLDDIDTAHAAFGYWLALNQNFAFGVQYLDGESDDYEFAFFGLLNDTVLEYNAILVSAEGKLPLGRENYLFARLGASFYDYDILNDRGNETLQSDDGTDFHVAAGWRKSWGSGLGLEVLYEYLPLGDDIEVSSFGAGITFSF